MSPSPILNNQISQYSHISMSPSPILPNQISQSTNSLSESELFQQKVESFSRDPNTQTYKFSWPPDFRFKTRILAVKDLYHERMQQGHYDDLH